MNKLNNNFDDVYLDILYNLDSLEYTTNKRTGVRVKEDFGYSFMWDMSYLPISNIRRTKSHIAAAELAWSLSGEKSIEWLKEHTNIWNQFSIRGEVETAYGYRWKSHFGFNQIEKIINALKNDSSSRQQVLMTWDPKLDGILKFPNIPCPFACVVGITGGKLNMHLSVRSNDVICGLPYDLYFYVLLGNMFANSLGIEVGSLFYSIANYHFYENQKDLVYDIKSRYEKRFIYKNPYKFTYEYILEDKDAFVNQYKVFDTIDNKHWEIDTIGKINK